MGLFNKFLKKKKIEKKFDSVEDVEDKEKTGKKSDKVEVEKKVSKKEEKNEKPIISSDLTKKKKIEETKIVKTRKKKLTKYSIADKVLVHPLITEKSAVAESVNKYSFIVAKWANKLQIKRAIKDIYGITPTMINTVNIEGKKVRFKWRQGRRKGCKKAVITLPKGKSINIHEGV
ncbi:MAG: 50S ribosomal protein L23 [Parcubacteria group bacterium]|nr:50S ribosomal protein L23 [Parcubacteria group bacterium]